MHRFKELEIWKRSKIFCSVIYTETNNFPSSEQFGLTNQIRRSAVSIPSNIAEGASRTSQKEFSRFLEIALGSAYEMETQILIAEDLKFLPQEKTAYILDELNQIVKMISKFRSQLKTN
ncbi:four helix bundle protein [Pustulibacterium marinum]|uniref:Four helix bundle protein n=1 Tax=Pustulibacterium marinum TaxID=1224947 RepID=A0A1I7G396_9FLAO|nr:four helix bundle protein [Pustulibacterium marinum]SFU42927.1 four helix bundle protein [Pustulibacterium marinum]